MRNEQLQHSTGGSAVSLERERGVLRQDGLHTRLGVHLHVRNQSCVRCWLRSQHSRLGRLAEAASRRPAGRLLLAKLSARLRAQQRHHRPHVHRHDAAPLSVVLPLDVARAPLRCAASGHDHVSHGESSARDLDHLSALGQLQDRLSAGRTRQLAACLCAHTRGERAHQRAVCSRGQERRSALRGSERLHQPRRVHCANDFFYNTKWINYTKIAVTFVREFVSLCVELALSVALNVYFRRFLIAKSQLIQLKRQQQLEQQARKVAINRPSMVATNLRRLTRVVAQFSIFSVTFNVVRLFFFSVLAINYNNTLLNQCLVLIQLGVIVRPFVTIYLLGKIDKNVKVAFSYNYTLKTSTVEFIYKKDIADETYNGKSLQWKKSTSKISTAEKINILTLMVTEINLKKLNFSTVDNFHCRFFPLSFIF